MGWVRNNIEMAKPMQNTIDHEAFINGEKVWKDKSSPYADYLTNMKFALDYHDVVYNGNAFSSIFDSSDNLKVPFSTYNMSQVVRAADGSMHWQNTTDGYRYIKLTGLNTNQFSNGMTFITMFKPNDTVRSPMRIGTLGHSAPSVLGYVNHSTAFELGSNTCGMYFGAHLGTSINPSAIVGRYNVFVTVTNWSSGQVYLYQKTGNALQRLYYISGSAGSTRNNLDIHIGVDHDNDIDVNNAGRANYGLNSSLKYIFMWNEVFNQTKIENFIKDVLINEF